MVSPFALAFIMFKKLIIFSLCLPLVSCHEFAALNWSPAFQVKTVKIVFHLCSTVSLLVEYCMMINITYSNETIGFL